MSERFNEKERSYLQRNFIFGPCQRWIGVSQYRAGPCLRPINYAAKNQHHLNFKIKLKSISSRDPFYRRQIFMAQMTK